MERHTPPRPAGAEPPPRALPAIAASVAVAAGPNSHPPTLPGSMVSAARGGARRRQGVRVETDGAGATRAVAVARRGGVALVLRAGMGYGRVGKATQPRRERRAAACHPLRCSHLDGDTVLYVRRNAAAWMEQLLAITQGSRQPREQTE